MNFLAHAYLSGNEEQIIFGNLIADAVKGSAYKDYPEKIQHGILLHRFIDQYTDSHPVVEESKLLLRQKFNKYAPVVSDVYYDHFLAKKWSSFHNDPLPDFVNFTYEILTKYEKYTPEKSKNFIPWLIRQNWLQSYESLEGISLILDRMSRRAKFTSNMEHAGEELRLKYSVYESHFNRFFPELEEACNQFKIKL